MFNSSFSQSVPKDINNDLMKIRKMQRSEDNYFDSAFVFIQNKMKTLDQAKEQTEEIIVSRAIWNNCLGDLFKSYLSYNSWKISQRTAIEGEPGPDFNTWDATTFAKTILNYYQTALEEKEILQRQNLLDYTALIEKGTDPAAYEPTLYDFLVRRMLSSFNEIKNAIKQPLNNFLIADPQYLSDNETFAKLQISSPDELSFPYQSLLLYQALTQFHLQSNNTQALIHISIERIDYVYNQCDIENKNELKRDFLLSLEEKYAFQKGFEEICYEIGKWYLENGKDYDPIDNPELFDYNISALDYFQKAVDFAPKSIFGHNAKVEIEEITRPSVKAYIPNSLIPNQPDLITYVYKNCNKLYCRAIPYSKESSYIYSEEEFFKKLITKPYHKEWTIDARSHNDYRLVTQSGVLPALPLGNYIILISTQPFSNSKPDGMTYQQVKVSDLRYTNRSNDQTHIEEFLFYRSSTGEPLSNHNVTVWYSDNHNQISKEGLSTYKTDERGILCVEGKDGKYTHCKLFEGNDKVETYQRRWWYNNHKKSQQEMHLFTDRAIYRPGQTVHFKGILVESEYKSNSVVANQTVEVTLQDANYQKIETKSFVTNEFGSIAGEFTIPENVRTGYFSIGSKNNRHHFRVEEYKRPQFEVAIEKPTETYRLNDVIEIEGNAMAYAGYPIDGATVQYHVTRTTTYPYWRYWWRPIPYSSKEIAHGETSSDANGKYHFNFVAEGEKNQDRYSPVYRYEISVTVTDINGETHDANTIVTVGEKNLLLTLNLPAQVCADKPNQQFPLCATNLGNVPQAVDVTYCIERLQMPAQYKHSTKYDDIPDTSLFDLTSLSKTLPFIELTDESHYESWKSLEEICKAKVNTGDAEYIEIPNLNHYKDGYYKITASAKDKDGNDVSTEHYFFVFHEKSKKCPAYEALWLHSDKTTAEVGDNVTFFVGSYLNNANIFIELISNDTILQSEWLKLQQGIHKITLPIQEEYRGKLELRAFICDHNFKYSKTLEIKIPFSNKKMDIAFETFRDKTTPGAKEEWRITLKGKEGEKIAAELLCSMYDASLDVFAKNKLALPINYLYNLHNINTFNIFNINSRMYYASRFYNFRPYLYNEYIAYASYLNGLTEINYYGGRIMYSRAKNAGYVSNSLNIVEGDIDFSSDYFEESEVVIDGVVIESDATYAAKAASGMPQQQEVVLNIVEDCIRTTDEATPEVQIRSNFAETAFFYPQLKTDAEGNIVISCTLPESLTEWKMLGLAHTTDLKVGNFEKTLRTQKEVMVVPNTPRFFREGDIIWFSAKVVNTGEHSLTGQVALQLTDALTGQTLDIIEKYAPQPFSVEKGASAVVRFKLHIPESLSAITYRIVATCNELPFSDGQEETLPVLSNRMLVTETLPLSIRGGQTKKFDFNMMKEACDAMEQGDNTTLSHHKLTLEFTPNPIWYAIGSLPYMIEYPYECNEQMFSKFYSNALASHIANSSPAIQEVFNTWKNSQPSAFCSNLEKNEELKSIVLEESPWVMDAQRESEQKQQMGILFDKQRMETEMKNAISKLEKNQLGNGGWPWFAGGEASPFVTQHIVAGFGHLNTLGIDTKLGDNVIRKAVNYLDEEFEKKYREMKKEKVVDYLSSYTLHALYARSFYLKKHPVNKGNEAYNYYYNLTKNGYEKRSFYDQALIALILYRNGDKSLAEKIMSNLKSYAQTSDEMGMWWKKEGYGFMWNEAPIERQALLIEAFNTITHDNDAIEQMQTWLLKQKQTQHWGTTKATTEACYALLLNNDLSSTLVAPSDVKQHVIITIGDNRLDASAPELSQPVITETPEAGTGYFKTSWNATEIKKEMSHITMNKPTQGVAWGGIYWQYFENLDKIKQDKTTLHPLSIQKQLYKITMDERGEKLVPITEATPVKVGDKVRVRIELRADRDLEFVHLKDMRGATFELKNALSGYRYQDGLSYYEAPRDASVNFFFDWINKGTYVFEYTLIATQAGTFSNGISSVQCMYAPEFADHSAGITVKVEE